MHQDLCQVMDLCSDNCGSTDGLTAPEVKPCCEIPVKSNKKSSRGYPQTSRYFPGKM